MSEPSLYKGLASNSMLNLFGGAFPFVVSFVCVPFFIELIGAARYGVLSIFLISTVYLSFLDLGIPRAIVQRTLQARKPGEGPDLHPFASGLWLGAMAGAIGACFVYVLGHLIVRYIEVQPQAGGAEVASGVIWLALAIPVLVLTNILNGFLQASDGFLEINLIAVLTSVVTQVAPLILAALSGPYLPHLLAIIVLTRAAMLPLLWVACRHRGGRAALRLVRRNEAVELLRFGRWTTVSTIVGPLMLVSDRYVIGAVKGAVPVTQYSVPFQLAQGLMTLPAAVQAAILPLLTSANEPDTKALTRRGVRLIAVIMLVLVGSAILLVEPALPFLLRDAYVETAADVARIALLGVWANAVAYIPASQLQAQGRVRFVALVHLVELPLYAVALYLGVVQLGLVGAALVFALRCIGDAVVFHRTASGPAGEWKALGAMFVCLAGCCLVASNVTPFSLAWFVLTPLLLICVACVGLSLLPAELKSMIRSRLQSG